MSERPSSAAVGWTMFAAIMMILIGGFHAIAGVIGILDDGFYVVTPKYVAQFDATTWGWIHLLAGIVILLAGFGLTTGAVWARMVGVIMAVISAIAAFAWLPWYPIWGVIIIAGDVTDIWALPAHGRDIVAAASLINAWRRRSADGATRGSRTSNQRPDLLRVASRRRCASDLVENFADELSNLCRGLLAGLGSWSSSGQDGPDAP